jgi:hypothetical protein
MLLGISVKTAFAPSGRISVAANSDEARQTDRRVEHLNRLAASQSDHRAAVCVCRDTGIGRGEPGPMPRRLMPWFSCRFGDFCQMGWKPSTK